MAGYTRLKDMKKAKDISGRPTTVTNIAPVKGMFGEKRMKDLEKAVKNRNRRIKAQVKKLAGEYTPENYAKLARAGYLPAQLKVNFADVTSIKKYNQLMRVLEADKSREWKEARTEAMRNWMRTMVERSTYIDSRMDPELFAKISRLTDKEILAFRQNNKDMVSDFFEWYNEPSIDIDDRDYLWDSIRKSLGMEPLENKPLMFAI